ncbi:hypothetical protein FRB95_006811 [Tulasnella sp. JGI-2019a]|nr:hypothetical protein FRB95_006811 [Tulasnella sp. JGI-2019a]
MAVYYIARDNHLRDFIWFNHNWAQGDLDVDLGNEVCTGLHAMWHSDEGPSTICYTTTKEIHFRKEVRNDADKPPIVEEGTFDHPSDRPLALVVSDGDGVLMGTGDAGYKENKYTPAFTSLPLQLGPVHRITAIDCDPEAEMRFFVTEHDTLNQYIFDRNKQTFSGATPLVAPNKVASGSPITAAILQSATPTILAFFIYSGNKLGYSSYNYANPDEPPKAHAVPT